MGAWPWRAAERLSQPNCLLAAACSSPTVPLRLPRNATFTVSLLAAYDVNVTVAYATALGFLLSFLGSAA